MFIPIPFVSVNSTTDLVAGSYVSRCSLYGGDSKATRVILFEYCDPLTQRLAACDVIVIERNGTLRARDYVWGQDRTWRDSDGLKCSDLRALMPAELLKLPLVRTEELPLVNTGGQHE